MDIGTLQIMLSADMAQLKKDMNDAKTTVGESMAAIDSAVSMAKTALVGLAGIGSVMAFTNMVTGVYAGAASLKGLSMQAGITGEDLSALAQVGKMTGTSAEDIAGSLNKMSRALNSSGDDSKNAGAAVAALGINFDDFKRLKPDEQMLTVAEAMNGFSDSGDKSVISMALFGKEGAKMIEFLENLALTQQYGAKFTDEQIQQSKDFGVELKQLKASGEGWKSELAMGMLPALEEATKATLGMMNGSGGLRSEVKKLSEDGSIADWTRSAIVGATYVLDAFSGLKAVVITLGQSFGYTMAALGDGLTTVGEAMNKVQHLDFSGALDTITAGGRRQVTMLGDLGTSLDKTWGDKTLGQQLRDRLEDTANLGAKSEAIKPNLDASAIHSKNAKAVKEQSDAYDKAYEAGQKFIESINSQVAILEEENTLGVKLTATQKERVQLTADLENGTKLMTAADVKAVLAALDYKEALEEQKVATEEYDKAKKELNSEYEKELEKVTSTNAAMAHATEAMGLNKEQLLALTVARIHENAVLADQKAASLLAAGATSEEVGQQMALADAYRESEGEVVKSSAKKLAVETAAEWKKTTDSISEGLTGAFMSSLTNGKSLFVNFRNYLEDLFLKMVLAPTVNIVMGPIAGVINNLITSITGPLTAGITSALGISTAAAGGGAGGALAGAGGVASIGSALGSATGLTSGSGIMGSIGSALGLGGAGAGAAGANAAVAAAGALQTAGGGSITAGLSAGMTAAQQQAAFALSDAGGGGLSALTSASVGSPGGVTGVVAGGQSAGAGTGGLAGFAPLVGLGIAAAVIGGYINRSQSMRINAGSTGSYDAQGNLISMVPAMDGVQTSSATNGLVNALEQRYLAEAKAAGVIPTAKTWDYIDATDNHNGLANFDAQVDGIGDGYKAATPDNIAAAMAHLMTNALGNNSASSIAAASSSAGGQGGGGGFANGGDFGGGLRLVGERGPELEVTGPSRIFNADQTASMLRSGGANNDELIVELRAVRRAVEQSTITSSKAYRMLANLTPNGDALQTRAIA